MSDVPDRISINVCSGKPCIKERASGYRCSSIISLAVCANRRSSKSTRSECPDGMQWNPGNGDGVHSSVFRCATDALRLLICQGLTLSPRSFLSKVTLGTVRPSRLLKQRQISLDDPE